MANEDEDFVEPAVQAGQQALLAALVALLADEREHDPVRTAARKTEVLLADVGLHPTQIGPILGKKPDTVRMAVRRARQGTAKSAKKPPEDGAQ